MDKKEFMKALFIVGLLNTLVTAVLAGLIYLLAGLIYLLVLAIIERPFVILITLLLLVVGYVSAYIYLKFKEKE